MPRVAFYLACGSTVAALVSIAACQILLGAALGAMLVNREPIRSSPDLAASEHLHRAHLDSVGAVIRSARGFAAVEETLRLPDASGCIHGHSAHRRNSAHGLGVGSRGLGEWVVEFRSVLDEAGARPRAARRFLSRVCRRQSHGIHGALDDVRRSANGGSDAFAIRLDVRSAAKKPVAVRLGRSRDCCIDCARLDAWCVAGDGRCLNLPYRGVAAEVFAACARGPGTRLVYSAAIRSPACRVDLSAAWRSGFEPAPVCDAPDRH